MIKYEPKKLGTIKPGGIMIVGMCPGRQRKGEQTHVVFEGNRTGDFIQSIIKDLDNVYMTNVFNFFIDEPPLMEVIETGKEVLRNDINQIKPSLILCLGNFAYKHTKSLFNPGEYQIKKITHPSYILRFNKDTETYKNKFLEMIQNGKQ
jgi:uracil-DNA glycosylase family 4